MAFETSVLQNGEWTTRTLDVNTVLRHYDQQDQEVHEHAVEIEKGPVLGLLTQTVIRSPVVHWILPVNLRGPDKNDVVFIGDEFVQIKELRPDGHLCDVVRKENFGARIRNACVVGSTKAFLRDYEELVQIKSEDDDLDDMDIDTNTNGRPPGLNLLPPQVILLQLDSGDSIFFMLRLCEDGSLEFVSSKHRVSKAMLNLQPGTHLAVDPSSRYMAIGCSEGVFAIYALKPRAKLQEQYSQGGSLNYVEAERHIYPQGVILKINFLHPSPDDEEHIILLVLVIRKGQTRMLLYEWETGGDLRDVRPHSRRGHLLEEARQLPLLIIPLTIKSAFILVSATTMSICRDILLGSPRFVDISDRVDPPTPLFHGSGLPLWTSWARPVRNTYYTASHDDIYIVREDGFVKAIETDCKEEDLVKIEMNIGPFSRNCCGPALACMDYVKVNDISADFLISSGDSSAGATYLIEARKPPVFQEYIQNWSPAHDFVTDHEIEGNKEWLEPTERGSIQTDRIYTCAGKGTNGTITELRHGLEANVGLEISYDAQIMDIWVLSPRSDATDADLGSIFLLSLGDRSSVLYLSSDATEISELEPEMTEFDLTSRTLAASMYGHYMIQVTEQSVIFTNGADIHRLSKLDLLQVYQSGTFVGTGEGIELAIVHNAIILFTTRIGIQPYLQMVELRPAIGLGDESSAPAAARTLSQYSPNATCLSIGSVAQSVCVVTAEFDKDSIRLVFQPLQASECRVLDLLPSQLQPPARLGAVISIVVIPGSCGHFIVVCGTRNGILVTLQVDEHSFQIERSWSDRVGLTSVAVTRSEYAGAKGEVFVKCDLKIYVLSVPTIATGSLGRLRRVERKISRIFVTDAQTPIREQPSIDSITRLRPNLSSEADCGILLISGSQIRLAGLSTHPQAVPRHIQIQATPSRILYSHHLGCLIVAASKNGRSTLLFIDPETGDDLSSPVDKKNGNPVNFVSGLGNLNERVFRLIEWSFVKEGKTWVFIIVCTNTGRIVIISTQKGNSLQPKAREPIDLSIQGTGVRYWTLHKAKRDKPVYSVAGFDEGLIYCSGDVLYCEILDMVEKRFKQVAQYVLPSPAINLAWKEGNIYALTAAHSLEILRLDGEATLDAAFADDSRHQIIRTHGDQVTRDALHHQSLLDNAISPPLELVSDKSCSVVGLWATHNTRADMLDTIFEAQLPCSILRFRSGATRPMWDGPEGDLGTDIKRNLIPRYQESLGLSIDGSLFSFTVLDLPGWRFLRFLINLSKRCPSVYEFNYTGDEVPLEPVQEPKIMMHVDGDILRNCLDIGGLDELLCVGQETEGAVAIQAKFTELLQGLRGGELAGSDISSLVDVAYKVLEFFLRPVL